MGKVDYTLPWFESVLKSHGSVLGRLVLKNLAQRTGQHVNWTSGAGAMISSVSLFYSYFDRWVTRSLERSIARSLARSLAQSPDRSLDRTPDRSIGRSIARSIARSLARSYCLRAQDMDRDHKTVTISALDSMKGWKFLMDENVRTQFASLYEAKLAKLHEERVLKGGAAAVPVVGTSSSSSSSSSAAVGSSAKSSASSITHLLKAAGLRHDKAAAFSPAAKKARI